MDEKQCKKIVKKRIVISSYADIKNISPSASYIHLRKFASKKQLKSILNICPSLKILSFSEYAYRRVSDNITGLKNHKRSDIDILVSKDIGRPINFGGEINIKGGKGISK